MLKLRKLAVRKLYLLRGDPNWCHGVLDHGFNRNIPLMQGNWSPCAEAVQNALLPHLTAYCHILCRGGLVQQNHLSRYSLILSMTPDIF